MNKSRMQRPNRQQGAALIVSLILIFLMSIIGISAMQGATLEGQLANNSIQKELTLHAAEAASNALLNTPNSLENSICKSDVKLERYNELEKSAAHVTQATVAYSGKANPVGYSLGGPIGARRFVVTGTSDIASIATGSRVSQGVILIGASDMGAGC